MANQANDRVNINVARILRRIREILAAAVRYESSKNIELGSLHTAKINLRRISTQISLNTYNKLLEAIDALLLLRCEKHESRTYSVPRLRTNGTCTYVYIYTFYCYVFIIKIEQKSCDDYLQVA